MIHLEPLPLSPAALESYRIRSRRQRRPGLVGGHQMRRKGQSLEFHEYRPYIPGDDIRHIDWRASMRLARGSGPADWLVREFVAEEHLTLIVSVDTRNSMQLPEAMPKAQMAGWLAEAIAWIGIKSGDRVVLHRLFGSTAHSTKDLRGTRGLGAIRPALLRLFSTGGSKTPGENEPAANLGVLEKYLKPAVVWLLVSDFYFEEETARAVARQVASARDGMRWVILLDVDSWPYEKNYLGRGTRKIDGPGLWDMDHPCDINQQSLRSVEEKIAAHKRYLRELAGSGSVDLVHWKWPAVEQDQVEPRRFFLEQFGREPVLQRLFMREKA